MAAVLVADAADAVGSPPPDAVAGTARRDIWPVWLVFQVVAKLPSSVVVVVAIADHVPSLSWRWTTIGAVTALATRPRMCNVRPSSAFGRASIAPGAPALW